MELRGYILKPAPNPKYFGYPNPQIRGRRSKPEPETRKPETRGYPPRTRPAAILTPAGAGVPSREQAAMPAGDRGSLEGQQGGLVIGSCAHHGC